MNFDAILVTLCLAALVVGVASFAYARSQLARMRFQIVPTWDEVLPAGAAEVIATLPSAVVVLDPADRVIKATPAAFALGLTRERRLDPALLSIAHTVRSTGLLDDREIEFQPEHSNSNLQLSVRIIPLGPLHVLVLAEDRTEARRAEDVRRDFVANVSHELKTPIGAISLLAESMSAAADDPETVIRFASRLERESARLSRLVQEIIDLSKLQSSVRLDDLQLIDVDEVIAEAIDRCRLASEAKLITIDRGGLTGSAVFGDSVLLTNAVGNLVDNAVHYSDSRTRIGIGVRRAEENLEIAITDQGLGISAEDQERVFERFYRVDPARSRATGGTGLGLSIVKHVAAVHGGDVSVQSTPGQGSTFTLRLPAAPDMSRDAAADPDSTTDDRAAARHGAAGATRNRTPTLRAVRPNRKAE